ncbi:MAG: restriction endonuclease subunit S [Cyclobacteriaceae bacterium]
MGIVEEYKQTVVGPIPQDWELVRLKEVSLNDTQNGIYKPDTFSGRGCEIVNMKELFRDKIISNTIPMKQLELNEFEKQRFLLQEGDLLFARRSLVLDGVGKCSIVGSLSKQTTFESSIIRVTPNSKIAKSKFLFYYTSSGIGRTKMIGLARQVAVSGITGTDLLTYPIPLPPLPEQQAIAKVLSDTDKLIQSLEKKIAKKKLIKQGIMQKLLTPKEGWEVKKLGKVAEINMGQSPHSVNYNSNGHGLPLIQGNADLKNRKTIIRSYTSQITKVCNKGDIIMSVRAPVGAVALASFKACIGRGVCAIRYENNYLYHYLIHLESKWSSFSTGSTFDSINSDTLKNLEIAIPSIESQFQIASILDKVDSELDCLISLLSKRRLSKQGLMQQLLTGKIRLSCQEK